MSQTTNGSAQGCDPRRAGTRSTTARQLEQRQATPLRRRRAAALRCEPMPWRGAPTGLAARDPLASAGPRLAGPGTFGLTVDELRAEARKLRSYGWPVEEIFKVLDVPAVAA